MYSASSGGSGGWSATWVAKVQPKPRVKVAQAGAMGVEPALVALADRIDIADQGLAFLLIALELDPAAERQRRLGRVEDLEQMAAHASADEAAQPVAQRLQRGEEITDQHQPGMARQGLARGQAGRLDRPRQQALAEAGHGDPAAHRPPLVAEQGDPLAGPGEQRGQGQRPARSPARPCVGQRGAER